MMVPRKQGIIINISSGGGASYAFNVSYGVGKAAVGFSWLKCVSERKSMFAREILFGNHNGLITREFSRGDMPTNISPAYLRTRSEDIVTESKNY